MDRLSFFFARQPARRLCPYRVSAPVFLPARCKSLRKNDLNVYRFLKRFVQNS